MKSINNVNYESITSTSHNYSTNDTSSSPESFPNLVGNGVYIEYKYVNCATDVLDVSAIEQKEGA
mgnify:CR=1 FL=1